ncbi:MAG TPA: PIG-L family deacetylase [Gemmatimonadaceae bacterium]|nr:PIG-L family deacetylase [Gemmatimonadaceae bacterium]
MDLLARFCGATGARRPGPRTLVVCAHPDDETIGAGARLGALCDVTLVHVTDGAPTDLRDAHALGIADRETYARARRRERAAALVLAGVDARRVLDLGVVDQEASRALAPLARRLETLLARLRPEVVLTHPYEGGHPDHDATAFAVHAAVGRLAAGGGVAPVVLEMTSYHARGRELVTGEFLDAPTAAAVRGAARTVALDAAARDRKRRMLACYATQARVLAPFDVKEERFRIAPAYDFTRPPHDGRLWYEWFGWGGLTGARWRALAADALRALGLAPRPATEEPAPASAAC